MVQLLTRGKKTAVGERCAWCPGCPQVLVAGSFIGLFAAPAANGEARRQCAGRGEGGEAYLPAHRRALEPARREGGGLRRIVLAMRRLVRRPLPSLLSHSLGGRRDSRWRGGRRAGRRHRRRLWQLRLRWRERRLRRIALAMRRLVRRLRSLVRRLVQRPRATREELLEAAARRVPPSARLRPAGRGACR